VEVSATGAAKLKREAGVMIGQPLASITLGSGALSLFEPVTVPVDPAHFRPLSFRIPVQIGETSGISGIVVLRADRLFLKVNHLFRN
jgi:hypothetical protein